VRRLDLDAVGGDLLCGTADAGADRPVVFGVFAAAACLADCFGVSGGVLGGVLGGVPGPDFAASPPMRGRSGLVLRMLACADGPFKWLCCATRWASLEHVRVCGAKQEAKFSRCGILFSWVIFRYGHTNGGIMNRLCVTEGSVSAQ
jgi:hypothetical protein